MGSDLHVMCDLPGDLVASTDATYYVVLGSIPGWGSIIQYALRIVIQNWVITEDSSGVPGCKYHS